MSDILNEILEFAKLQTAPIPDSPRRAVGQYPRGFEPGVTYEGDRWTITPEPQQGPLADWSNVLIEMGFDPEMFEIIQPVQSRIWTVPNSSGEPQKLFYYKANVRQKSSKAGIDDSDFELLKKEIKSYKPAKKKKVGGEDALVVCLSDWQMGKKDGDGTRGTIDRVMRLGDQVVERVEELRAAGKKCGTLYVVGMGDLIENCDGFYPMQQFNVELNKRNQRLVVRRLIVELLKKWSPLFDRVVVAAIAGNHGEERKNGKAYTDFADNIDIAVIEDVYDIFKENSAYKHFTWVLPTDHKLELVLSIAGHIVAFAHGHQFRGGGGGIQQKAVAWWKDAMYAFEPAGDATILTSAHYHHFQLLQDGKRTWIQCPSLEGGSDWYRNVKSKKSEPGTLVYRIDPEYGLKDLEILR